MQKPKQSKPVLPQEPTPTNWYEFVKNDHLKLAIPVGPRFQAEVPDWTGPPRSECYGNGQSKLNALRWAGSQVWPCNDRSPDTEVSLIGKGRPDFCTCEFPGSAECVKSHITDERVRLQFELGPAFWRWKLADMGEEVSRAWSSGEQKKFESVVKMNPVSQGKSFIKPALECLPSQSRKSIVSYYFNVYIPRRMSIQTRAGCKIVDTDDEDAGETPKSKSSRKRYRTGGVTPKSSAFVKTRYLTGRR